MFLLRFILGLIRFVFRSIFRIIRTLIFLLVIGAILLFFLVQTKQIQLSDLSHSIDQFFQNNSNIRGTVDSLSDFVTDHTRQTDVGRWQTNTATVYIDTSNPTYQQAYQEAIANWNATGAFTFQVIEDKSKAQIIATHYNDSNSRAAGLAETHTDGLSGYLLDVSVKLNDYFLLNPSYGYTFERITHTAEHELGHAIGLSHNDNESSVMESAGSYTGIQETDIEKVRALYST
ncbi:M57 family metalloprotease [Streptococcus sp. DD13]|uniref:M57 family metalloprotease n=1 Tax=Streptococcus sp. DD13 TaxID=1777881 RepID=UPI0007975937|nr:M57 family metalloprotease [Streptococcus sp. DD13]KXT77816.1 putative Zn-dependent protease [Streptococcus sp. DD13]